MQTQSIKLEDDPRFEWVAFLKRSKKNKLALYFCAAETSNEEDAKWLFDTISGWAQLIDEEWETSHVFEQIHTHTQGWNNKRRKFWGTKNFETHYRFTFVIDEEHVPQFKLTFC